MVDLGDEIAFRWSEWVVSWEVNVKEEDTSRIGTIVWADNGGLPVKLVILMRTS